MMSNSLDQWIDSEGLKRLAESLMAAPELDHAVLNDIPYGDGFVGFTNAQESSRSDEDRPRNGARQALREASKKAEAAGILRVSSPFLSDKAPPQSFDSPFSRRENVRAPVERNEGKIRQNPNSWTGAELPHETAKEIHPEQVVTPSKEFHEQAEGRVESPFRIVSKPISRNLQEAEPRIAMEPVPMMFTSRDAPLAKRLQGFGDWMSRSVGARAYFVCDRNGELLLDTVRNEKLLQVARTLAHASSRANRQAGGGQNPSSMQVRIGPSALMEVLPVSSTYGLIVLAVIIDRPLGPEAVAQLSRALSMVLEQG